MSESKTNLKNLLRDLHDKMSVSGNEQEVVKYVYNAIKPYADEVTVTPVGNIIAVKKGARPGPTVAIGAHVDEIGFIVRAILPNGFLLIDKIGGVPNNLVLARTVLVSEKRIPGVIGTKPGHLQTPEEAKSVQPISKCYVDLGLNSAEEVKALGIKIGDPVVFKTEFIEMANPDIITARAVDDKINCALIIELFKNLKSEDFGGEVVGVFTVREEVGLFGAKTALDGLKIDYSLALDTVPAGDTPDINTASQLPIHIGKGPGLIIADSVGVSYFQFIHPRIRELIEKTATKNDINLQVTTILGHMYTTDAAAFSYANQGIPTAGISIPRRYSHSPVELFNLNDAVDVLNLVHAIVKENENFDTSFCDLD